MAFQTTVNERRLYFIGGDRKEQDTMIKLVNEIGLTGDEKYDRLLIQSSLCDNPFLTDCCLYYDGNIIYPFNEIIANFVLLKKEGTLAKMNHQFRQFLFMNFGRGRYDHMSHIGYFNNNFDIMWNEIKDVFLAIPETKSDVKKIFEAMCSIM